MCKDTPFKNIILNKSKDETKCLLWLNIGVEEAWSAAGESLIPKLHAKGSGTVQSAEQMCMLLADSNDIVIVREKVPDEIIESMSEAGFDLPEIWRAQDMASCEYTSVSQCILENKSILDRIAEKNSLIQKKKGEILLMPYAVTETEHEIASAVKCRMIGSAPELTRWINSKTNARTMALELDLPVTEGFICRDACEIADGIKKLIKSGCGRIVIKDAYGSSGKGAYLIDSEKSLEMFNHILMRKSNKSKQFDVIVEKWYEKKADVNYQLFIKDNGAIVFIPPKKQVLDGFVYVGSEFPAYNFLNGEYVDIYKEIAMKIGRRLFEMGCRGIVSIDSIITKDDVIYPIIEINGRFSLSTYISFIPESMPGIRYFKTRYYNVYSEQTAKTALDRIRLYNYTPDRGEGLVAYSYSGINATSQGRMHMLYAFNELQRLHAEEEHFENIFKLRHIA